MCKAIDDMIEEGRQAGMEIGRQAGMAEERQNGIKCVIETCKGLGATWETALKLLVEKFSLNEEEGAKYMKQYW